MKAERDDMPDYLKPEKKEGPWKLLIAIGITSAVMWGLVAKYGEPIVIDITKIKEGIYFGGKPVSEQQRTATAVEQEPYYPLQSIDSNESALIVNKDNMQVQPENSQERQTVFNDQNYRPRTDINTMESVRPVQYAANTRSQNSQAVRKNNYDHWTWTYANRDKNRIRIEWETVNGWIDTTTVCHQERKGSIEYRDCRKAAKEYFAHRCKTENRKAFCHAQSFNPL